VLFAIRMHDCARAPCCDTVAGGGVGEPPLVPRGLQQFRFLIPHISPGSPRSSVTISQAEWHCAGSWLLLLIKGSDRLTSPPTSISYARLSQLATLLQADRPPPLLSPGLRTCLPACSRPACVMLGCLQALIFIMANQGAGCCAPGGKDGRVVVSATSGRQERMVVAVAGHGSRVHVHWDEWGRQENGEAKQTSRQREGCTSIQ